MCFGLFTCKAVRRPRAVQRASPSLRQNTASVVTPARAIAPVSEVRHPDITLPSVDFDDFVLGDDDANLADDELSSACEDGDENEDDDASAFTREVQVNSFLGGNGNSFNRYSGSLINRVEYWRQFAHPGMYRGAQEVFQVDESGQDFANPFTARLGLNENSAVFTADSYEVSGPSPRQQSPIQAQSDSDKEDDEEGDKILQLPYVAPSSSSEGFTFEEDLFPELDVEGLLSDPTASLYVLEDHDAEKDALIVKELLEDLAGHGLQRSLDDLVPCHFNFLPHSPDYDCWCHWCCEYCKDNTSDDSHNASIWCSCLRCTEFKVFNLLEEQMEEEMKMAEDLQRQLDEEAIQAEDESRRGRYKRRRVHEQNTFDQMDYVIEEPDPRRHGESRSVFGWARILLACDDDSTL